MVLKYLQILKLSNNGNSEEVEETFCGDETERTITPRKMTVGSQVRVKFQTYVDLTNKGFLMSYETDRYRNSGKITKGYVTRWPHLGLLSGALSFSFQIIWRSGTCRWHLPAPYLQVSGGDFNDMIERRCSSNDGVTSLIGWFHAQNYLLVVVVWFGICWYMSMA